MYLEGLGGDLGGSQVANYHRVKGFEENGKQIKRLAVQIVEFDKRDSWGWHGILLLSIDCC